MKAANLEVTKQYLTEFSKLAQESNTLIIPANLTNVSSLRATAM